MQLLKQGTQKTPKRNLNPTPIDYCEFRKAQIQIKLATLCEDAK